MPARLTVFVPGLFGPLTGIHPEMLEPPRLTALESWWSLGRPMSLQLPVVSAPEQMFLLLFGVPCEGELPGARLSLAAQGIEPPSASLWRADPVYARAGTVDVHIDDRAVLPVTAQESETLCRDFNRDFDARGWRLWASRPGQWYLQSTQPLQVTTVPLSIALGRGLEGIMPSGPDGARLRALLNELQMWLFEHPLNQAREAQGCPPINSIWPLGAGEAGLPRKHWRALWAVDDFYRGAGKVAGADLVATVPADGTALVPALPASGEAMLVLDSLLRPAALGDVGQWYDTLQQLDRDWFAPLLDALVQRRVQAIHLAGGARHGFVLRRGDLWRIWRRRHPLTRFVTTASGL